jgi:hypothetical protein
MAKEPSFQQEAEDNHVMPSRIVEETEEKEEYMPSWKTAQPQVQEVGFI